MRRLDYNLLRVFRALMEEQGVTRAAGRLGLTQSSTSNALERLRDALGDRVLEREGNAMVPTMAARALWEEIGPPLLALEAGLSGLAAFDPVRFAGELRVGIDDYVLELIGPALVEALAAEAPAARFGLLPTATGGEAEKLFTGEVDAIVGSSWRLPPGLRKQTLFEEDFVAMVDQGHPLADTAPSLERYLAFPHVLVSGRGIVAGNVDAALGRRGLTRRVTLSLPGFGGAPGFLFGTDRILNIGRRLAMSLSRRHEVALVELPLDVPGFDVSLIWHPRNTNGAQHQWLRRIIAAAASALDQPR